jgi:hypothetical protein
VIRKEVSLSPIRSCAFRENPKTSTRRSSGFLPRKKPCLLPLECLAQGETLALLGLASSQVLPSLNHVESISLPTTPSRPSKDELVTHLTSRSLRDCPLSNLASPLVRGADLSGLSHRPSCPTSLEGHKPRDIFSPRSLKNSYEPLSFSSLRFMRSRLAEGWPPFRRHTLFPVPTFGAPTEAGLPASRRHSPRQAEFSAS